MFNLSRAKTSLRHQKFLYVFVKSSVFIATSLLNFKALQGGKKIAHITISISDGGNPRVTEP